MELSRSWTIFSGNSDRQPTYFLQSSSGRTDVPWLPNLKYRNISLTSESCICIKTYKYKALTSYSKLVFGGHQSLSAIFSLELSCNWWDKLDLVGWLQRIRRISRKLFWGLKCSRGFFLLLFLLFFTFTHARLLRTNLEGIELWCEMKIFHGKIRFCFVSRQNSTLSAIMVRLHDRSFVRASEHNWTGPLVPNLWEGAKWSKRAKNWICVATAHLSNWLNARILPWSRTELLS